MSRSSVWSRLCRPHLGDAAGSMMAAGSAMTPGESRFHLERMHALTPSLTMRSGALAAVAVAGPDPAQVRENRSHRSRDRRGLQVGQHGDDDDRCGERRPGPTKHGDDRRLGANQQHDPARPRRRRTRRRARPARARARSRASSRRRHGHHDDCRLRQPPLTSRSRTCGPSGVYLRHTTTRCTMEHGVCRKYMTCR